MTEITAEEALEELEFLKKSAQRKAESTRERRKSRQSKETQERIALSYDRERDALQMAIDALTRIEEDAAAEEESLQYFNVHIAGDR